MHKSPYIFGVNNLSAKSVKLSSLSFINESHLVLSQTSSLSFTPIITQSLSRLAYSISGSGILILPCLSQSDIVAPDKKNLMKLRASLVLGNSRYLLMIFSHSSRGYMNKHPSSPLVYRKSVV